MGRVVKFIYLFFLLSAPINRLPAQVSFCAVGDVLLDRDVKKAIEENGINYPFDSIAEIIQHHDLAFFNLECPLVDVPDGYPISKKYSFRAEPGYIGGIKYAGFNIASVANNHTIDYGKSGFLKTIENLNRDSIYTIGGGANQAEAFEPLLLEKNGETFAFFGVLAFLLEGTTFNTSRPYPAFGQMDELCRRIRALNPDIDHIVVSFHWGHENVNIPDGQQIEYAHRVVDAGADLVLGHHPHVLQSIETYKGKLILYSLGNFIFDNSQKAQKESVIFRCSFQNGQIIDPELIPVYINKCQPVPAPEIMAEDIFGSLKEISNPFNTTLTRKDFPIKINYHPQKTIRELNIEGQTFYLFEHEIVTYSNAGEQIEYSLPDSSYFLVDADIYTDSENVYIYSVLKNRMNQTSRIAVFPFSMGRQTFLQPSLDSHDDFAPWKIRLLDVDEDDRPELIVGVKKTTRYDKKEMNRIFVYNTDKEYFFPKWLGSKLGNPVVDFKADKGANRLLVLEKSKTDNAFYVVDYQWNGFGFDSNEIIMEIKNPEQPAKQFQLSGYDFKTVY